MAIGEKILGLRKEKSCSQQALAKKVGTSCPIVSRYEIGEMVPSVEVEKKLADVFGVTMDYLVDNGVEAAQIKDKRILERLIEIEQLDLEEKRPLCMLLTACQGMPEPEKLVPCKNRGKV